MPRAARPTSALRFRALVVWLAALFALVSGPSFAHRYAGVAAGPSFRAPSHASKTAEAHAAFAVRSGHAEQARAPRGDGSTPAIAVPNDARTLLARTFVVAQAPRSLAYANHVPAKTHAELMVFLN